MDAASVMRIGDGFSPETVDDDYVISSSPCSFHMHTFGTFALADDHTRIVDIFDIGTRELVRYLLRDSLAS